MRTLTPAHLGWHLVGSRRSAWLASIVCCAMLSLAGVRSAAGFTEFVDPNPAPGNQFGSTVLALSTGNVVITSPYDDAGGTDAGAVYLFNGANGALISALRGSTAGDHVGSAGVTAVANGNFVISSQHWSNGAMVDAGAVTWASGTTGVSGAISSANSLVGSTANDNVGATGAVVALSNGNYVVASFSWDNGAFVDAGAATWGSGTTGVSGVISTANSLVGTVDFDEVGVGGAIALTNGNYVVASPYWGGGVMIYAGAVTWGSGTTGVSGVISTANSLVGSSRNDNVGSVTPLSNGNYVVTTPGWENGPIPDAGAATWCSGTSGQSGVISPANSLVGATGFDQVGTGVTALSNGNYVVRSPSADIGGTLDAGAVSWSSGTSGLTGAISAANSLVGSSNDDRVGIVTALSNGNYVVTSDFWDIAGVPDVGAATWGSGTTGVSGPISFANSLVGSTSNDRVGIFGVTALSNGNYVVPSPLWDSGVIADAGAATWGSGTAGVSGVISSANSLVGSTIGDDVGSGSVTALSNGNYVVSSTHWHNGVVAEAGAATWGSGVSGVAGIVSSANSLVGSTASDNVSNGDVTALSNGNYVVISKNWDSGGVINVGAVTWGSGTAGATGLVSSANSMVGSTANDLVGNAGVKALVNGNYVISSPFWDHGAIVDAGAATLVSGTSAVGGAISAANSLVGSSASDKVGLGVGGVVALSNGNFVVSSQNFANSGLAGAGAVTWGSGATGVSGAITAANSLIGTTAGTALQATGVDNVNGTFFGPFVSEVGGRVRVGLQGPSVVAIDSSPPTEGIELALVGARPNPARGSRVMVHFTLRTAERARIELIDVSGRRVASRDVGALGAGPHAVDLAEGRPLSPGIYMVKLTQGLRSRVVRAAVLR